MADDDPTPRLTAADVEILSEEGIRAANAARGPGFLAADFGAKVAADAFADPEMPRDRPSGEVLDFLRSEFVRLCRPPPGLSPEVMDALREAGAEAALASYLETWDLLLRSSRGGAM